MAKAAHQVGDKISFEHEIENVKLTISGKVEAVERGGYKVLANVAELSGTYVGDRTAHVFVPFSAVKEA